MGEKQMQRVIRSMEAKYLALIEEVEKYVRYEPDNPTYIRNTVDSREMYDMAFGLL